MADVAAPRSGTVAPPSPLLSTSVKESGRITVWDGGETFTLDSAAREVRSSGGLRVILDGELFPQVLTVFQAVLEGDVYAPALESMVQECPRPEMCVEPYSGGGHPSGGAGNNDDRVFQSGAYSSRGNDGNIRIILSGRGSGGRPSSGDVFALSTDDCGDIAGRMLGTITSFRESRSGWVTGLRQVLWDWGVGEAVAVAGVIGAPQGLAIGLGTAGANAFYSYTDMGILGALWHSNLCASRTVRATGFVMLPGSPPGSGGGGGTGGGGTDGMIVLYCEWKTTFVEIAGKTYPAELKVCSYHSA